ncbi:DeoR/GlpR family DNA-binding transcription regulator [Frondihabitans australicus]|uniref:DeoR family transcriptional regulator n=1 Tax=Frondihabitans australicus TaxID=386892 RepID=A0A495IKE2_9MICO|nr:DeoR/GlpR family DNA-binding transcription regulator [Frondihabitans australicus]RKR76437.1 DeoR family transcriptional regulator [Frondihabitans australicus]
MAARVTNEPDRLRPRERRAQIVHVTTRDGLVDVDHLARLFDVTASTIRRDLSTLTADGELTRTYGGAIAASPSGEPSLGQRAVMAVAQKEDISRAAARFVLDDETVILDAGTTVGRLARRVRSRRGLTVITNGMTALAELADAENIHVISLGGDLRGISQGFVGPLAELALTRLTADRVFLGADSIDARFGICEASPVQTRLKELMMAHARDIYVLADSSKFGLAAFDAWAPLDKPWTLITDSGVTEVQLAPFRARGDVTIVISGADDDHAATTRNRGQKRLDPNIESPSTPTQGSVS